MKKAYTTKEEGKKTKLNKKVNSDILRLPIPDLTKMGAKRTLDSET